MMQGSAINSPLYGARLESFREYGEFGEAVLQDDTYRASGNSDKCFPTTTTTTNANKGFLYGSPWVEAAR